MLAIFWRTSLYKTYILKKKITFFLMKIASEIAGIQEYKVPVSNNNN
jgi:hypothetical protein